jgi:hypothetical protein
MGHFGVIGYSGTCQIELWVKSQFPQFFAPGIEGFLCSIALSNLSNPNQTMPSVALGKTKLRSFHVILPLLAT